MILGPEKGATSPSLKTPVKGLVSIVVPTYNASGFVKRTLSSLLAQTYRDIEVIVVDDASTDNTFALIEKLANTYPNVEVIRNGRNMGVCETLKKGIRRARGEFIAIPGHDDIYEPGHIENLVEALHRNPAATAAFADVRVVDVNDNELDIKLFSHERMTDFGQHDLFARLLLGNFLCAPASLIRANYLDPALLGDRNDRLQDFELWLNLLPFGPFERVKKKTVNYSWRGNNLSSGKTRITQAKFEFLSSIVRLFEKPVLRDFVRSADDPVRFAMQINDSLARVSDYCPPLKALRPIYAEKLLSFTDSSIEQFPPANSAVVGLQKAYEGAGMLRKSLSFSDGLRNRIPLVILGMKASDPRVEAIVGLGLFTQVLEDGLSARQAGKAIYLTCGEEAQQVLNSEHAMRAMREGRIIITTLPQFAYSIALHGRCLLVDEDEISQSDMLKGRVVSFLEDQHRQLFSSRLFLEEGPGDEQKELFVDGIIIQNVGSDPKVIWLPNDIDVTAINKVSKGPTQGQVLAIAKNSIRLGFDRPEVEGDLLIQAKQPIRYPDWVTINNRIFVANCVDITRDGVFARVSLLGSAVDGAYSDVLERVFEEYEIPSLTGGQKRLRDAKRRLAAENLKFQKSWFGKERFFENGEKLASVTRGGKKAQSCVDQRINEPHAIKITGWAMFSDGVNWCEPTHVIAVLDGVVIDIVRSFTPRSDVNKKYNLVGNSILSGFELDIQFNRLNIGGDASSRVNFYAVNTRLGLAIFLRKRR